MKLTRHSMGYMLEGRQLEHVAVAERALGKPLPKGAEVHHWNEIKTDNTPSNLVICPNRAYHMMLHYRARALAACGNASFCKCEYCKEYDEPARLVCQARGRSGVRYRHRECHATAQRERLRLKRHATNRMQSQQLRPNA